MPTYHRFEELPVWLAAASLFEACDEFLSHAPSRLRSSFRDQLERASLSVSNNIAEGFERGTTKELLSFIYIARGSAGEVRSMLALLTRRSWILEFHAEIKSIISLAEGCSRQLRGWADTLQNSEIDGPRHLNQESRATYTRRKDRREAQARVQSMINQHLPEDHPMRKRNIE